MTTFARIVNGFACDVVITPPTLQERFHPEWLERQIFVVVPDGTQHGASDNGNGTFSNPPERVPEPPVTPELTDLQKLSAIVEAIAAKTGVDVQATIQAASP